MVSRRIKEINDIVPFYYSCVECGTKGSFHGYPFLDTSFENDLQDWIDAEDLDKSLLFKDNYKAKELVQNIFKDETSAIISKLPGKCSKCRSEMDLNVWVKFHVYDQEDNLIRISIENTVLLDGTGLIVESIPGFYRGVDIASGLHKLYLRWWFLEGDIYVFCPFLKTNLQKISKPIFMQRCMVLSLNLAEQRWFLQVIIMWLLRPCSLNHYRSLKSIRTLL